MPDTHIEQIVTDFDIFIQFSEKLDVFKMENIELLRKLKVQNTNILAKFGLRFFVKVVEVQNIVLKIKPLRRCFFLSQFHSILVYQFKFFTYK